MANRNSIHRRHFLKLSSAAVITGLTGKLTGFPINENLSLLQEAVQRVGILPRRKLGYSGREVSILLGAGDMASVVVESAAACGINYWHKASKWMDNGAPEVILQNREAHYCQVTVDRVGGDHFQGHQDEESHYRFVKEAVKKSGLAYFDDMQFHYGYHNTDELKKDRSFIRAFERLKKEGLVKHICLSQHSYDGSPRVKNGQSAAEILTAVVEDGIYENAQFMYSYGGDPEMDKFIDLARQKNFGTIAMKTARGIGRMMDDKPFMQRLPAGTSPHNALARWLTTKTKLDAAVIRVRNMDEFVETYSGAGRDLTANDLRAIELMTAEADKTACRLCGKCQSKCPQQIPITDILRFERYAMDDHNWNRAMELYTGLPVKGDICIKCGICVQSCPLNLHIPEKLAAVHILLNKKEKYYNA